MRAWKVVHKIGNRVLSEAQYEVYLKAKAKRIPSGEGEIYDLSYKLPAGSRDPYDFSQ